MWSDPFPRESYDNHILTAPFTEEEGGKGGKHPRAPNVRMDDQTAFLSRRNEV